jgi:DNA-directed RNA polymerase specialized sigma24 family protein
VRKQPVGPIVLDEDHLEPLVKRTLAGDKEAWPALWLAIDPLIEKIAGRWRVTRRPAAMEDERRNIVVRVMELLKANEYRRLSGLHEALLRRDGSARAWLLVVTRRVAITYARRHAERLAGEGERQWAELSEFSEELPDRLPESLRLAAAIDAHRLFACAEQDLEATRVQVLRAWVDGKDHRQIAEELGHTDDEAVAVALRGALMHVRRRFERPAPKPARKPMREATRPEREATRPPKPEPRGRRQKARG